MAFPATGTFQLLHGVFTQLRFHCRLLDLKYNQLELKNIAFDEKKFPMLFLQLLRSGFLVVRISSNKRRTGTEALILGRRLLDFFVPNAALIRGRRLFVGGAYLS